jgi:hypothetical protein
MKLCDRCHAVVQELHTVTLYAGFNDKNHRWIIFDREFCWRCKQRLTDTVHEAVLEAELMIHRRYLEELSPRVHNKNLEELR